MRIQETSLEMEDKLDPLFETPVDLPRMGG